MILLTDLGELILVSVAKSITIVVLMSVVTWILVYAVLDNSNKKDKPKR